MQLCLGGEPQVVESIMISQNQWALKQTHLLSLKHPKINKYLPTNFLFVIQVKTDTEFKKEKI